MRRILLLILSVFLVCLIIGLYFYFKPRQDVSEISPVASITAIELYNKYSANETTADSIYSGKVIEVKGTVSTADTSNNSINVSLRVSDFGGVICSLNNTNNQKKDLPKPGSLITVKGRCTGFLADVTLVDCIIEK